MVVVPHPVRFTMGSPDTEPRRDPVEVRHQRLIDRSFAIGAHEGTVQEFRRFRPDFVHAVERVAAAAEAARALPFLFTVTARTENYGRGNPNLDDTLKRLVAFEKAGADVLFAPGLPDLAAVSAVCSAVAKPVNFMVGIRDKSFSAASLAAAGVRRISFAASLYRAAMTGLLEAAREAKDQGTFDYLKRVVTTPELNALLGA